MLITKEGIKPFVGRDITVWEYGGLTREMDVGVARITGEYPGEGKWARNIVVETMTYYVLNGTGRVTFDDGTTQEIKPADCLFISKGRGYKVAPGSEGLTVLMASNPAWSPDQYEVFEKEE